jgi:hypothetical protein
MVKKVASKREPRSNAKRQAGSIKWTKSSQLSQVLEIMLDLVTEGATMVA